MNKPLFYPSGKTLSVRHSYNDTLGATLLIRHSWKEQHTWQATPLIVVHLTPSFFENLTLPTAFFKRGCQVFQGIRHSHLLENKTSAPTPFPDSPTQIRPVLSKSVRFGSPAHTS